jgi:hypothetical protein
MIPATGTDEKQADERPESLLSCFAHNPLSTMQFTTHTNYVRLSLSLSSEMLFRASRWLLRVAHHLIEVDMSIVIIVTL